jgi:HNH endonuclease
MVPRRRRLYLRAGLSGRPLAVSTRMRDVPIEHTFGGTRALYQWGKRNVFDWDVIQRYYDRGHTRAECMAKFGFSPSAWTKAVRRFKLVQRSQEGRAGASIEDGRFRYDWAVVQRYHDEGHTRAETTRHFGFCSAAWTKAVERGVLKPRPAGKSVPEMLATVRSRYAVKLRLLRDGILVNRCDLCGLTEWRGLPISIQIHHRNGIRNDHRLENLMMLCPNCHSQTESYGAKNRKQTSDLIA